jgi:4-hydroxybenzoyl-CoA thioesterase
MKNTFEFDVEFGDTDPAAIVFYPHFLEWCDAGTWRLFIQAGFTLKVLQAEFGLLGFPVVEVQSKFRNPVRFGDHIRITSEIVSFRTKTFQVAHEIYVGDRLCNEGTEIRVLGRTPADDPEGMEAVDIPDEIRQRLS